MRLPPFQLHEPETLEEATELLEKYGEDARAIAGGTVLVPMMRYGLLRPGHLVSLGRVSDLRGTSVSAGELRIGALATHHCLSTCRDVRVGWPLLARAAGSVATPAIRATGTLGGNLVHAESSSDLAPALLVLGASLRLVGPAGERTVSVDRFFLGFLRGRRATQRDPDQCLRRPCAEGSPILLCSRCRAQPGGQTPSECGSAGNRRRSSHRYGWGVADTHQSQAGGSDLARRPAHYRDHCCGSRGCGGGM